MKEGLTSKDKRFLNSVARNLTSNGYQPIYSIQAEGKAERTGIALRAFRALRDIQRQRKLDELAWAQRVTEVTTPEDIRQGDMDLYICDELGRSKRSINFTNTQQIFGHVRYTHIKKFDEEVAVLEKGDPKDILPRMISKANMIVAKYHVTHDS